MSEFRFADGIDRRNHLDLSGTGGQWGRKALLLAAAAIVMTPGTASAQGFWGWGGGPGYVEREMAPPPAPRRMPKPNKKPDPAEARARAAAKPQGPLVIAVSLASQRVKVYDANGLFAESPVSTGTRSHPTPAGVFSIIQKNRHHVSNLYYAQMPYMQRITWSGVAFHTGALPGFAASHGCIRLPNEFAARLWTWTKMGTRVIVSHGEVSPVDINHAKLIGRMTPLQTVSAVSGAGTSAGLMTLDDRAARPQVRTADATDTIARMQGKLSDASSAAAEPKPATGPVAELKNVGIDSAGDGPVAAVDAEKAAPAAPAAAETITKPADIAKPADAAKPAEVATPAPSVESAKPPVAAKSRAQSHVAVFISRKDRKLYVRQGYEPVFDTPIEITDVDRPLGTHVFTARNQANEAQALTWSVVSVPQPARAAAPKPSSRAKSKAAPVVAAAVLPTPSASEALDRIAIPTDAQEKIAALIAPGGSILISDHGLGWETGRGTDFIVPIR